MVTRRQFVQSLPAFAVAAHVTLESNAALTAAAAPPEGERSWHSPSLTMETVTGPSGAVTTRTQLEANALWGLTETPVAEKVVDGVYALRGWGIASSYAIEAPDGWIIVDTGDSTRAAAEMRELLERTLGKKIKVAAILLTHWHYGDGTGAWLDEGTEIWGHEHLDRNRSASKGVSVKSGFYQTRAIAQFAVFHPAQGPDAFPSLMRFFPEKLLVESSYEPPTKLFEDGKILDVVIAGEPCAGGAQPHRHVRQRGVLLSPPPPGDDEHDGDGNDFQHLHAPRRPLPRSGELHQRRTLGRIEERRDSAGHPWADVEGRKSGV